MDPFWYGLIISALPIAEVRVGIPVALQSGMNPVLVVAACILVNIAVVPFVFLFLETIHHVLMRVRAYQRTFDYFMERTRHKAHASIEKYGYLGMVLFVGIPLPGTGAYTGALAAWFFGMEKKKAFLAISFGVVAAALLVTAIAMSGAAAFKWVVS